MNPCKRELTLPSRVSAIAARIARPIALFLLMLLAGMLASCNPAAPVADPVIPDSFTRGQSPKRGLAYNVQNDQELTSLAPGVSWWYNWSQSPAVDAASARETGMEFVPMVWNFDFENNTVRDRILALPDVQYLLVLNEPNLTDQANLTPQAAALQWPRYEALADSLEEAGKPVQIVGPAMNWGTMDVYGDYIDWLDAFYAAYRESSGGEEPRIDCLAFHWYDYGLEGMLDRLAKYGKPVWVTEMANCNPVIDTEEKAIAQMTEMVALCEKRTDVVRYAWFTGRWYTGEGTNYRFASLFEEHSNRLTALGEAYISLPHKP